MCTAKYFAHKNNLKVNIDKRFNERIHGVDCWEDLPKDFEKLQFMDEYYKVGTGESQKEVLTRMNEALNCLLNEYIGKKIIIVSHATAISFLLKMYTDMKCDGFYYDGQKYFDGCWNFLETFKLVFDENKKLINIKNFNYKDIVKE